VTLRGHFWTVAPHIIQRLRRDAGPEAQPWTTTLEDATVGSVRLTGLFHEPGGARALLLVVHGLGGSASSHYAVRAARAAEAAGLACLRLSLRGADVSGEDFYNAGLIEDLRAAVESPEPRRYESLLILGFSLGGHLALRYAVEQPDPRVRAVAAVCAPLDLKLSQEAIDRPGLVLYRHYLLANLRRVMAAVEARRPLPVPLSALRTVRTLREWDRQTVVPRFGFASPEDYYTRMSVGPHLARLRMPALLVAAESDPMVPLATLRPSLAADPANLTVQWASRGGHVGFPPGLDLGFAAPPGLERQLLAWLQAQL
jgi:predicted alpha/beta-fold hydrolase